MSNRQDDALPVVAVMTWSGHVYGLQAVGEILKTDSPLVRLSDAKSAIASLQARLDAAEKDAARWRWFAGDVNGYGQHDLIQHLYLFADPKDEIDAIVNAEMKGEA